MEYRLLGKTDMKISVLGYGASPLGNVFGQTDEAEGVRAVHYAIEHGINYFDVAPMYGVTLAEQRLGKAIKGKRDKIYLATKCGRYDDNEFDFSAKRVKESIDESLRRLQTDYVDVYQIHDVEFGLEKQVIEEAIPAAREVVASGKARYVGITGLPVHYLKKIAEQVEIDTILSWGHYNLVADELDTVLRPVALRRGFGLLNSSPWLQRLLTEQGPLSWQSSPQVVHRVVPEIIRVCRRYGMDIADVALRHCLDYPHVATTISGMSKLRHAQKNIETLELQIDPTLFREIEDLVSLVKNRMWFEGRPENNITNVPAPEQSFKTAAKDKI
ncbi:MAG: aldo/keto reductase [Sedimentisphaerales bacterium]|nr:aldo/keto reductase [Sedimentisphaerales bacterium]